MGFVESRRWAEPTIFRRRRPCLMQIYLTAGYPKLIIGDPYRVVVMMHAIYGEKSYMAIRVLRPWRPTEVTRYDGQTKTTTSNFI